MTGSDEEIAKHVALPYFDLREGELLQMRSQPQLHGFRRGLRARMASLGYSYAEIADARVLMAEPTLALIQFDSLRHAPDGAATCRTTCLAYLRIEEQAWRVWMITVLKAVELSDRN